VNPSHDNLHFANAVYPIRGRESSTPLDPARRFRVPAQQAAAPAALSDADKADIALKKAQATLGEHCLFDWVFRQTSG
jgi:hypothetical protein